MMMPDRTLLLIILYFTSLLSCTESKTQPEGSLYIIGGGKRPPEMVKEMMTLSGADKDGTIVILPMASAEPDTSAYYASSQFMEQGAEKIEVLKLDNNDLTMQERSALLNASLVYIPGGSQARFMDTLENTDIAATLMTAYRGGAMIAGTSAGAAVQSELMITGDQHFHSEYTGYFRSIEANNIVTIPGLGFLKNTLIDQHFIKRQRLNRLISACIDHPDFMGIGIDESTAIHVKDGIARVSGLSQVIVLECPEENIQVKDGLQGVSGMQLSVYLPGESFEIYK